MPATFALPRQVGIISGLVAPGSVLRFYQTGTSTPQSAYTDAALSNAVTSVTADASGVFAKVYLNPNATADYRVTLENSAGVVSYTEDNISRYPVSAAEIGAALYPRTAAEIAAGVTPTNYAYPPGNVLRYGAAGDGTTSDQAAFQSALAVGVPVYVPAGVYRLTAALPYATNLALCGEGMGESILLIDHAGSAFVNSTGGAVLFMRLSDFTIRTNRVNVSTALPLTDVSRSVVENIIIDRAAAGQSFGIGVRLQNSASVSLWNKIYNVHVTCVTGTALYFDSGTNGNKVYGFNLINATDIDCQRAIYFNEGSTNYVFGAELEAIFDNGGSAVNVIEFSAAATQNGVYGARCEGYSGTANAYAVVWNGATGNIIHGLFAGGLTGAVRDTVGKNYYNAMETTGNGTQYLGGTGLEINSINMTPAEGAFTATLTGVTTTATGTARYVKHGNLVVLYLPSISATSNATTATLTGAPAAIFPARTQRIGGVLMQNSGVTDQGTVNVGTDGVVTMGYGATEASFTASGTKGIFSTVVSYLTT